jgi:hypothetical protein
MTACPSGGLFHSRRRVQCKKCGVVAELLSWAEGKHTLTNAYMQSLANAANPLRRFSAPLRSVHLRTAGRPRARRSGQFAMGAPFSHKGTGWPIVRNFAVVPAGTRT